MEALGWPSLAGSSSMSSKSMFAGAASAWGAQGVQTDVTSGADWDVN